MISMKLKLIASGSEVQALRRCQYRHIMKRLNLGNFFSTFTVVGHNLLQEFDVHEVLHRNSDAYVSWVKVKADRRWVNIAIN